MPSAKQITKTIHADWWAEGEVCVIRRLSYGQKQRLNALMGSLQGAATAPTVELNDEWLALHNVALLQAAVVSMTDEEGEPVEMTGTLLGDISGLDGDFILEQVQELNPTLRGVQNPDGGPFPDDDAAGSGDSASAE